jgi:hypothetical protein
LQFVPPLVGGSGEENVKITQGEDNIGTFNKTPQSYRKWCKTCGGHVFTEHPGLGLTDVLCCGHS